MRASHDVYSSVELYCRIIGSRVEYVTCARTAHLVVCGFRLRLQQKNTLCFVCSETSPSRLLIYILIYILRYIESIYIVDDIVAAAIATLWDFISIIESRATVRYLALQSVPGDC